MKRKEQDVLRQMYDLKVGPKSIRDPSITLKQTHHFTDSQNLEFEELQRKNNRLEEERRCKELQILYYSIISPSFII